MSLAKHVSLTLSGRTASGISIPIGATIIFDLEFLDPDALTALDLTGDTIALSLAMVDAFDSPVMPPVLTKAGVITGPAVNGLATVTLDPNDTKTLKPGRYALDIWLTDAAAHRIPMLVYSHILLIPAATPAP